MTPESIRFLYNYNYWAFERAWDCIMQLTDDQFTMPIDFSMGEIRNHVVHMMSGSRRWIDRLEGRESSIHLTFTDYPTRESVKLKWDELRTETLNYINNLDQAQLDEVIPWSLQQRKVSNQSRRWELLLHLVNHSTDHRAQIMTLLHTHFHVQTVEQDITLYLSQRDKSSE